MKTLSKILCLVMSLVLTFSFVGCKKKNKGKNESTSTIESGTESSGGNTQRPDALVIMSDPVDGLFSPFFATTGADMEVVGMTQVGMLSTGYEGAEGEEEAVVAFGNDEPVVVLDYDTAYDSAKDQTTYRFVLKNGIVFSDGVPLTINDVLFNMYVYLDPVYTGSSTMYSIDIVGLQEYRTQKNYSSTDDVDDIISSQASGRAADRINELVNLYRDTMDAKPSGTEVTQEEMEDAIANTTLSQGYKQAVSINPDTVDNAQLQRDYDYTLELFKKELETDYVAAMDAFKEEPYKSAPADFDEILSFMYYEGYVTLEYAKKINGAEREVDDRSRITKVTKNYSSSIKTKQAAIDYVFADKINGSLDIILRYYATAQTLSTEYMAQAKEVILHENVTEGELVHKNISGIKSLGHDTAYAGQDITINNKEKGTHNTYKVAREHNADGTPAVADTYDVLQITINGVDPKAIWNFGFTVAPQHYYAPHYTVDIANNKFGVEWGSFDFMKNEIQSTRNVKIPMGAGAYKATNAQNSDNPDGNEFNSNNVIYYKANDKFMLGTPKIDKLRLQVVSSSNALDALAMGSVHYVTPQFTKENADRIARMEGVESVDTWQLGYGYIGVNAGKVPNINIRRAIMSAMQTSLALNYYSVGTVKQIAWPMSTVSWAYPRDSQGNNDNDNGHSYMQFPAVGSSADNDEAAKVKIQQYMNQAGVSAGSGDLKIKFTIAGSNLTEHPTYLTFKHAADLLNDLGWDVEVVADVNALNKLSTGSLSVWAAAWGTSIDPDMYQVYHKNSTATSPIAWGYREIKASPTAYPTETRLINQLSGIIDDARETEDRELRKELYRQAMGYVLDLAIEMPVYQRKNLFAYNSRVIKTSSLPAVINPYSSPLSKIWEVEFA